MEMIIKAPNDLDCDEKQWLARYTVTGTAEAMLIRIQSRSSIEVVVANIQESYYISSPNFGVAIPDISSLESTNWITDALLRNEMPAPDAVTIAQVLREISARD